MSNQETMKAVCFTKPKPTYKLTIPDDRWYVPDKMYLVDSVFCREENVMALETKFDVITDKQPIDKNHLFWDNYHQLTADRLKSFLSLKGAGLYFRICSNVWTVHAADPYSEYEAGLATETKNGELEKEKEKSRLKEIIEEMLEDYTDIIALLIHDYPEHFKTIDLKNLVFNVQISYNDVQQKAARNILRKHFCDFYKRHSRKKNFDWKFNLVSARECSKSKFHIDVHLNQNSYVVGLRLLRTEDFFPFLGKRAPQGSPVCGIAKKMNITADMVVVDLKVERCAKNILEVSKDANCRTFGIVSSRNKRTVMGQLEKAIDLKYLDAPRHEFIVCDDFENVRLFLDISTVDCFIYWQEKPASFPYMLVEAALMKIERLLSNCKNGCSVWCAMTCKDDMEEAISRVFDDKLYNIYLMEDALVEVNGSCAIFKFTRNYPPNKV